MPQFDWPRFFSEWIRYVQLSKFDEGPDLVLFYKYLLTLSGENGYALHFNPDDELSASQKDLACTQLELFKVWWDNWPGTSYAL